MATTGQQISYSNTQPQKRVVADRIIMTDPMEFVAINALGLDNVAKFAFVNAPGRKYEWLEDTFSPRSVAETGTALNTDSTTTTMSAVDGGLYQAGDVLLIDAEYFHVTSISGNTLTLATRSFGGTQATHADISTVYVVGRARLEGAAAGDGHYTSVTTGVNYSSIFQKTIEISRSNALLQRYGIPDVVEREIDKKLQENLRLLNLAFYHGQKKEGSATTPRSFGGLKAMITTNATSAASAALTRKAIEDEVAQCWSANGQPDLILCGQWAKRKIASFYEGFVRTERSEMLGGIEIDRIMVPLGLTLNVAVDRDCPADYMFILDRRFIGGITIDPFFEESLGKSKDTAYYGQVVGEYGFVVANEAASSILHTFSTTA